MQAVFVLTVFFAIYSLVVSAQQKQQIPIHGETDHPALLPSPFTAEWVQLLEQFYNTFGGHRNSTRDEDDCPVEMPAFNCDTFYWHDGLDMHRSARHLRPQVERETWRVVVNGWGHLTGRDRIRTSSRSLPWVTAFPPDLACFQVI